MTVVLAVALIVESSLLIIRILAHRAERRRSVALAVSLFASVNRVRAVCDEWDVLSKGPTATTTRIRSAIGDVL